MNIHPFADTFPLLEGEEFDKLVESIRENGQLEPVLTYQGVLIDGRNRLRACEKIGINAQTKELEGDYDDDQLKAVIMALNVHRRHLTTGQKAYYWASMANASVGKKAIVDKKSLQLIDLQENNYIPPAGGIKTQPVLTAEQVGSLSGISTRTIERAKFVKRHDESVFQQLATGEVSVKQAENIIHERRALESQAPDLHDKVVQGFLTIEEAQHELYQRRREAERIQASDLRSQSQLRHHTAKKVHEQILTLQETKQIISVTCPSCAHVHELKLADSYFQTISMDGIKEILKKLNR